MKKILLIFCSGIITATFAQTNTFPVSGNVGIGTVTPQEKLDVNGNIQISNASIPMGLITEVGGTTPLLNMSINFRETYKTNNYKGAAFRIDTRDGTPLFQWLTRQANSSIENISMVLSESGNVGIGTTDPYYPMQVTSGSWAARFGTTGSYSVDISGNQIQAVNGNGVGSPLYFNYSFGGNVIMGAGNVGIGTASPSEKLSVNGNIRSKKLIVTQTGWSDYVFDSSYQLKSLTEIERFIKANKHLPDIPSVKEVAKDGIDVGENQALLLKKIEELTLYMIEMKKENVEIKKKLEGAINKITYLENITK